MEDGFHLLTRDRLISYRDCQQKPIHGLGCLTSRRVVQSCSSLDMFFVCVRRRDSGGFSASKKFSEENNYFYKKFSNKKVRVLQVVGTRGFDLIMVTYSIQVYHSFYKYYLST